MNLLPWDICQHLRLFFFSLIYYNFHCSGSLLQHMGSSLLHCRFFLVALSGSYSSLQCLASHCSGTRASVLMEHGLSSPSACGIFPEQESKPCLALAGRFLSTDHQGSPMETFWLSWLGSIRYNRHSSDTPRVLCIPRLRNPASRTRSIVFIHFLMIKQL